MDGPQPINHRHTDFQSRFGSPEALYFNELPGRPLLLSASLCITVHSSFTQISRTASIVYIGRILIN